MLRQAFSAGRLGMEDRSLVHLLTTIRGQLKVSGDPRAAAAFELERRASEWMREPSL